MKKNILICALLFMMGCGVEQQESQPQLEEQSKVELAKPIVIRTDKFTVKEGYPYHIEKYVIEGHEYLLFSDKLADAPSVIHSASCPCHNN